jgi:hypothetical protein
MKCQVGEEEDEGVEETKEAKAPGERGKTVEEDGDGEVSGRSSFT